MLKVLVTGATGQLGSGLVDSLLERGESVRALVLQSDDTVNLRNKGVEICVGDLCDADSIRSAA
ncbi:MAG: NmrA family NAD(P)-binding protein, partial [Myxococcota bacterium]|nr:NmrA family NAD(P)-binding protein [Myxococcota bacterium]